MNHARKVQQFALDGELINLHKSLTAASKKTKIEISLISRCCLKFSKSAGGYQWRFYEPDPLDKHLELDDSDLTTNTAKL